MKIAAVEKTMQYRLSVIGLPRHRIKPFVGLVLKWVQCSGEEWTAKRLKSIKVDLIRHKAGLPCQSKWVRKNSSGYYHGVIGSLFRWCDGSSKGRPSEKRFNIVLQTLNCYTLFEASDPTISQIEKFLTGVNSVHQVNRQDYLAFAYGVDKFSLCYLNGKRKPIKRTGSPMMMVPYSPNKRAPRPNGLGTVPQNEDLLAEVNIFPPTPEATEFRWKYSEVYNPVTDCVVGPTNPLTHGYPAWDKEMYAGEVHLLQEPGFKLRAIASPYRLHQMALRPLGDAIYDLVKSLPWDCTFSQEKAFPFVQSALKCGTHVHSVDLTGATDYFPLELQLEALRQIFGDVLDIDLLEEISKMKFKSSIGDIQWKTGQPLGLYPSFGMFTLAHGLLLFALNKGKHDNAFFVVGDDVVILNDDLADAYKAWLERNHCPFSPEKSLSSNLLAEFAGKIITERSVIPAYKWRKVSDDNFTQICVNLGSHRSRSLLSEKQKEVFDVIAELCPPVGLGFNPKGLPFSVVCANTERFLSGSEKTCVRSLVDLSRRSHRLCYESPHGYSIDAKAFDEHSAALDERVVSVFSQTVVKRWDLITQMSDLPEALGIPGLPLEDFVSKRISTLRKYLRIIRKMF